MHPKSVCVVTSPVKLTCDHVPAALSFFLFCFFPLFFICFCLLMIGSFILPEQSNGEHKANIGCI